MLTRFKTAMPQTYSALRSSLIWTGVMLIIYAGALTLRAVFGL